LKQNKTTCPHAAEYKVYCTFQSHEPEFDYLKSLEIEEKINALQWLRRSNPAHFLLSTNGLFICFWHFYQRFELKLDLFQFLVDLLYKKSTTIHNILKAVSYLTSTVSNIVSLMVFEISDAEVLLPRSRTVQGHPRSKVIMPITCCHAHELSIIWPSLTYL